MGWTFRDSNPDGARYFLFSTLSRPALGSTEPPVKCVLALFSCGKVPGVLRRPTTTILTPSLRMNRTIEMLPSVPG
jgi:hypothetical protein